MVDRSSCTSRRYFLPRLSTVSPTDPQVAMLSTIKDSPLRVRGRAMAETRFVFPTGAAKLGVALKPMLIGSDDESPQREVRVGQFALPEPDRPAAGRRHRRVRNNDRNPLGVIPAEGIGPARPIEWILYVER